ncbi:uncharacterized protein [Rutidosis leptorrhynchoides]|uniref:uncharacterized protein n=1 Tax=Rutidosis leptorrhynchoides TaxID=125765 RepID=UPI003A9A0D69
MGGQPGHGQKADRSWRMFVDYKDINKSCPKDNSPLPKIDSKIKEKLRSLQAKANTKMPFGLKNTGLTYQKVIEQAFQDQIGRNIEAYVVDISKADFSNLRSPREGLRQTHRRFKLSKTCNPERSKKTYKPEWQAGGINTISVSGC